jgi:flagellar FliL protein
VSVTTTVLPGAAGVADQAGATTKRSRKKALLIVAGVLLLLTVGGLVAAKSLLGGPAEPEVDPKTVAGKVITLAPLTLNLADGRYLKLTLALQLSEAATPAAGSVDEAAAAAPALDGAKALDAAIGVLGQRTYAQLLAPGGRDGAQRALSEQVRKLYPGDVLGVYFTEFLMQ